MLYGGGGGIGSVIPPFERGNGDRGAENWEAVELGHTGKPTCPRRIRRLGRAANASDVSDALRKETRITGTEWELPLFSS
jgi:hypothetical protein